MAHLNHLPGHGYPHNSGWVDGSMNGSNMSLNIQPGYPQIAQQNQQQQWMQQWPGMYPYPMGMVPMVPAGEKRETTI